MEQHVFARPFPQIQKLWILYEGKGSKFLASNKKDKKNYVARMLFTKEGHISCTKPSRNGHLIREGYINYL